ncbi:MAG: hypothetical protein IJZ23_09940 [Roseburia sp.]|nr:hypothetical protein [Roseburia sp.]
MQSIFLGGIKNLLHSDKGSEGATVRIMQNLGKSNYGLKRAEAAAVTALDSFDITKHISELLSPACGMTEEEKQAYFNKIMAKLKSGQKLTPEEMRFLQAEYPELYQQAARVQAMRDGFEARLKTATSKQKAQEIYADSLSHVADDDPMKEYIVASYQDAMKEFEKTDEYKELPETEEEAKEQRYKKKFDMDVTIEFSDTEKAS